jgi:putative ABC transport system permease protein
VTLAGLAARNVLRNKFRMMLTVLGVAIAVLTFVTLRTVLDAWSNTEIAVKDRIVTRHKITFVMPLPKRYVHDVSEAKDASGQKLMRVVTWANWFGGKDPKHEHEFFASLAADFPNYFDVYDEIQIPADQREAFMKNRSGAIVGDQLASKMHWSIGDTVNLESGIFPTKDGGPWTFKIDGIYTTQSKAFDRLSFFFHWDRMNDELVANRQNEVGWIVSRASDPAHATQIGAQIDKIFEDRDTQTLTQDERSFFQSFMGMFSAVLKALDIVSVVILLIMTLILGNTIAMGVRERTNEYGVLKAIGFRPGHILMFIMGEAALTALLGGVLGLVISYPLVQKGLGGVLTTQMPQFFRYFAIPVPVMGLALALSFGLGLFAAAIPAVRASRLKVTDALRRVA